MTTVSKSFTDVDTQSDVLALKAIGEVVTVAISGTYAMTLELQREVGSPFSGTYERVLGPWSTANATVSAFYSTTKQNERLRLACTADTSGTAVTTISDGVLTVKEITDNEGNVLEVHTQDSVEFTNRIKTKDGTPANAAHFVGRTYSGVSATDTLLASAGASAHVDFASTYSIPANTIGLGTIIRISGSVLADQVDGTDTLEVKLYLGGTTLLTTTAFDPSAVTDFVNFEFELVSRAAPAAAAALVGKGEWVTSDNAVEIRGAAVLATTNFATNGALVVKASAKWSSTTALTNARLHTLNVEIL